MFRRQVLDQIDRPSLRARSCRSRIIEHIGRAVAVLAQERFVFDHSGQAGVVQQALYRQLLVGANALDRASVFKTSGACPYPVPRPVPARHAHR